MCVMKKSMHTSLQCALHIRSTSTSYNHKRNLLISPTHKRAEGRAPVWGSEFTSKRRRTTGGIQQKPLHVKLRVLRGDDGGAWCLGSYCLFYTEFKDRVWFYLIQYKFCKGCVVRNLYDVLA